MQHQTMESYIEDKKKFYSSIHEFFEESDEYNEISFQELIKIIRKQEIEGDREEMCQFLEIIKNIGEHHHRDQHFNEKMNRILLHFKDQIKQTLSNTEIFHIFKNNKKVVHFLVKKGIMTISDEICPLMISKIEKNGNRYWHFFIPELEKFVGEEKMKSVKKQLLKEDPNIFDNYEEKRQEGENDSYICSLIRQDLVVDFIAHINRHNISPSSLISPSIFETNKFLIGYEQASLIEYSAFFGSIQIFRYLLMNKAEIRPSLCLYTIHSNNAELIHLLESTDFLAQYYKEQIFKCFIESIKCHHNDIAKYIENDLLVQKKIENQDREKILSNCIKYHNYAQFQNEAVVDHGFFYLSYYHYDKLFELLLKKKEKSIGEKVIQYQNIQAASEKNDVEAIYFFLLKMQKISNELFKDTKITKIAIPSSITSIGDSAFYGCTKLAKIIIPSSVISIGNYAFSGFTLLSHVTIPSSVTSIGNYAFSECILLSKITIPSSVTSIGDSAFMGCSSLTQITIPSSVTSIGNYAFYGCTRLTQVSIPSSVTSIGDLAFENCLSLTITGSIQKIKDKMFRRCKKLKQISIPSSVTSIGDSAFKECSSLEQIAIPSSVTSIGEHAFYGCESLKQISFPSSLCSIGSLFLANCPKLTTITIVKCDVKRIKCFKSKFIVYKTNINSEVYDELIWVSATLNSIRIPESIEKIRNFSFYGCSALMEIIIPFSVTSIGDSAFSGCSSLLEVAIPPNVTSIGNGVFEGCSSLTYVSIPSSVTSIGDSALKGCSSLTEILIPSSVTSIGNDAFTGCSSLIQVTIPQSVASIGERAFSFCSSLTQILIQSSITSIQNYTFNGCSSLKQIEIPPTVTSIGIGAFGGCSSLAEINIPPSVTSISSNAFNRCTSLPANSIPQNLLNNRNGLSSMKQSTNTSGSQWVTKESNNNAGESSWAKKGNNNMPMWGNKGNNNNNSDGSPWKKKWGKK